MVKNNDWNTAMSGNEDWNAAINSEVFRNFVKITLAEERQEQAEKQHMEEVLQPIQQNYFTAPTVPAAPASHPDAPRPAVPNPFRSNLDYVDNPGEEPVVAEASYEITFGETISKTADIIDAVERNIAAQKQIAEELKIIASAESELGLEDNIYYQALQAKKAHNS